MDHTLSMMQITPSLHKQASTATMPHLAPTWKLKVIKNTLASSLDSTLPSTTHWIQPCSFNIDEKIRSYCCPVNRWLSAGRGLLLCQWGWTRAKILKEYRSILGSSGNCSSTWSYAAGRGRAEQSSHVNCVVDCIRKQALIMFIFYFLLLFKFVNSKSASLERAGSARNVARLQSGDDALHANEKVASSGYIFFKLFSSKFSWKRDSPLWVIVI